MTEENVSRDAIARMIEANNQTMMTSMAQLFQKSIDELKKSYADSSDVQVCEIKKIKTDEPMHLKRKRMKINSGLMRRFWTLEKKRRQQHKWMLWTKWRILSRKVRTYWKSTRIIFFLRTSPSTADLQSRSIKRARLLTILTMRRKCSKPKHKPRDIQNG